MYTAWLSTLTSGICIPTAESVSKIKHYYKDVSKTKVSKLTLPVHRDINFKCLSSHHISFSNAISHHHRDIASQPIDYIYFFSLSATTGLGFPSHSNGRAVMNSDITASVTLALRSWKPLT